MNISNMIAEAAIQYPEARKGPFGEAPIGNIIKNEIPEAIRNKLLNYVVKGSIGNGRFASIPWIAIMDREITSSTTEGFYIVFLFSSDGKRVYLTLNQGITYFNKNKYKQSKVKDISNKIYERFPSSTAARMEIDLNSDTPLGKGYESTTVSAFEYDTSNMPTEEKLLSDLDSLLSDYAKVKQFFVDNDKNLEKFYSKIMRNDTSNKYKEFKYLLKRFVEQGNINIQDKDKRKTTLGIAGFDHNHFQHSNGYDHITIDGVEYHIHLFNNGSYGPFSGNGSKMLPYFCHGLANEYWANIRATFQNFEMKSLRIVEWNKNSGDKESGISYMIDTLDLFSDEEPNYNLKKLYKEFSLLEGEENSVIVNDKANELADKLEKSKNIILRGAPGTGKTYLARQIAASLIGEDEDKLNESEQYGFVQFHPSYDYSDFVEGLRPITGDEQEQVSFKLVDGIFKKFCKHAAKSDIVDVVDNFDTAWENLIHAINESTDDYIMDNSTVPATLNSHNSIKFRSPVATKENVYKLYRGEDTNLKYETYQNIVLDHLTEVFGLKPFEEGEAVSSEKKKYIFVIDEINRGEISKIFGELFFSIDPGYRGEEKYGIYTQCSNLHINSKEKFYIPDNVYIIGTMNDIDRSVDSFDFAMRRRFRFIEIKAEETTTMWQGQLDDTKIEEATNRLVTLNKQIADTDDLNSNYHIGPSYFLKLPELDYNYDVLWTDYLQPLLEEYLRGNYEEQEKLDAMKNAYDLIDQTNEENADEDRR
ncbi:MrcB family domain-containing protein [Trichococcus collinsii]|uniref:5-methylcytosine-specific restriction endonuclease McrBC, GTP-binding regulatory subunit McrB n=1 Tax=Trichococcus collinsii TaxID=157076 RepID=A0AB37ZX68_9LACT|nr:DUF3578 domain-containing protein [Trichococcus collinsii]CZQ80359.1 Hypothetical protein Tcol_34 [Trichococcus collinsii]SDZ92967.1 5-methylcytosine-specific restriction endonuclease McrBC, GTP-binding regulatory subunit McrB [Trichococcus collinsii]